MSLFRLALRNISGSAFRSWVVALCALLVAGFTLATTLLIRGTETSLRLALDRLGADIIVVPEGSESKVEGALLMGATTRVWMPMENLAKIAAREGVAIASPQLYLSSMTDAPCCSVSDMFLVAFDPATDFTIQPWLLSKVGSGLKLGEAVGGRYLFVPQGAQSIEMYGYFITLKANLETTGSGLDRSMFVTFDTAREIARTSLTKAVEPLEIPDNSVSAVLVKVKPGYDTRTVALDIAAALPGTSPIASPDLFQAYREQISGMLKGILVVMGITWVLSLVFVSLVFTMAANERRREIGVLRALGATRRFVFRSLVTEAGILALGGGFVGVLLVTLGIFLFRKLFTATAGLPLLLPSLPVLLWQIGVGLLVTLASVALASFLPAYKISHQDPAVAMRE